MGGISFPRAYDSVAFVTFCFGIGLLAIPHVHNILFDQELWALSPTERVATHSDAGVIFIARTATLESISLVIDASLRRLDVTTFAHHATAIFCCYHALTLPFYQVLTPFFVGLIHLSSAFMPSTRTHIQNPITKSSCDIAFAFSFLICRGALWIFIEYYFLCDMLYVTLCFKSKLFVACNIFLTALQLMWSYKIALRLYRKL